jgi:hypothetical protein
MHSRIPTWSTAERPLIYATGRRTEPPEVNFPTDAVAGANGSAKPARERTSKLETEPYLRSLPVYRYRAADKNGVMP